MSPSGWFLENEIESLRECLKDYIRRRAKQYAIKSNTHPTAQSNIESLNIGIYLLLM
jgi:hypothetical protein